MDEASFEDANMIGDLTSVQVLLPAYANASSIAFTHGIQYLQSKYNMRKIRGDGNCFYRAFLFAYLEQLLTLHTNGIQKESNMEQQRILSLLIHSKDQLISLGYEEVAFETFYDMLIELITHLFTMSMTELLAAFQETGESDYYTWFMRLLTAGAIRGQAERFLPFISDDVTVNTHSYTSSSSTSTESHAIAAIAKYCRSEVEPMGRESEQVHITALTEFLGIVIHIEYLDGRSFDAEKGLSKVIFNELGEIAFTSPKDTIEQHRIEFFKRFPVHLLYRPGHFDILYPI